MIRARISRAAAMLAAALAVLLGGFGATASAHQMPTSAVLVDVEASAVTAEVQLPLDRLSVALRRTVTATSAATTERAAIEAYVAAHVSGRSGDGRAWTVDVGRGHVGRLNGAPAFVVTVTLTPPDGGKVTDLQLRYDVIVEQLVTHRAIATIRSDFAHGVVGASEPLGVFDYRTHELTVRASGGSWLRGMTTTAGLGVRHVAEGADHLLFLLMLLLTAPLVAVRGRWTRSPSARRSAVRVVHVVSAFALGHTVTLVLAGLGVVHVPSQPVETLIAVSIAVSAIHAIRPIVRGGEVAIAAGFGLVHGLAFASFLGDLRLDGGTLVSSLLGFNLGIELTQLLVVALVMPSLLVLAATRWYPAFRVLVAGAGLVLAGGWVLDRTSVLSADPFAAVTDALVGRPLVVAAAVALLALVARSVAPAPSAGPVAAPA